MVIAAPDIEYIHGFSFLEVITKIDYETNVFESRFYDFARDGTYLYIGKNNNHIGFLEQRVLIGYLDNPTLPIPIREINRRGVWIQDGRVLWID